MKDYYFLSSLPRAGNTYLSYILNKNKDIGATANSIIPDMLFKLYQLKYDELYKNFPDEGSYLNVYTNILDNYFSAWKSKKIICRGPWGTKGNIILLKPMITKPKFILLHRPLEECLNSFALINKIKKKDLPEYANELLSPNGVLGKSIMSMKNILDNNYEHIVVFYKDLVLNTEEEIKKIHKFIGLKYKKLDLKVTNQFSTNGIEYDDSIYEGKLHELYLGKPKSSTEKMILPKKIINQCRGIDVF